MGCGASGAQAPAVEHSAMPEKRPPVQNYTWATKMDGADGASSGTLPRKGGGFQLKQHQGTHVVLQDADDDDGEIEIIYEGKKHRSSPTPSSLAANAQEAVNHKQTASDMALSQRQKEEAAKLAEQRKRFDNQRYQRELAVGGRGAATPTAALVAAAAVPPVQRQGTTQESPRNEMVMSLNLPGSPAKQCQGVPDVEEVLPGGVATEPSWRDEKIPQPNANKNKHDMFDDDDEDLMKEILDSVEV